MLMGIDLGGTNIHAGVVTSDGELVKSVVKGHDGTNVMQDVLRVIEALRSDFPDVACVGVACPSQVDKSRGVLLHAANIPELNDFPLVSFLEDATGLKINIDNDATAAALAEGWVGMARQARTFMSVTLGTGVGTGVVLDGAVYRGGQGWGSEWGHLMITDGSLYRCGCGNYGCIETHCSATALYKSGLHAGLDVASAKDVCGLVRGGDAAAVAVMAEYAQYLGRALYSYSCIIAPETIVLGGGLTAASDLYLPAAKAVLAELFAPRPHMIPEVVCTAFPSHAGIVGAAYLCLERGRITV